MRASVELTVLRKMDALRKSKPALVNVDPVERYGPAFAKALAVFIKELGSEPVTGVVPAVADPLPHLPDALLEQARAEIERNERLIEAGKLEVMEFTQDSPAIGLANRLKAVIREKHLSQKELAARLGVSPSFIHRVLQRPERSRIATLTRIAKAVGIHLRDIV